MCLRFLSIPKPYKLIKNIDQKFSLGCISHARSLLSLFRLLFQPLIDPYRFCLGFQFFRMTIRLKRAAKAKSGFFWMPMDMAAEGMPKNAPSVAAETVPE